MPQFLPWILASLSVALLVIAGATSFVRRRRLAAQALPRIWALTPRPVFSSTERRLYGLLREALPQQIVLAKLPLVRFCQPSDPATVRYWYSLLGSAHVNFAICTSNGRVLAVIDIEGDKQASRRSRHIKLSVLTACRVRYLRCSADRLPSIPELQMLVPINGAQPRPTMNEWPGNKGPAVKRQVSERATLWQDSGFMQDSFFGMDGRNDVGAHSGFSPSRFGPALRETPPAPEDVGGVVIDTPVSPLRH